MSAPDDSPLTASAVIEGPMNLFTVSGQIYALVDGQVVPLTAEAARVVRMAGETARKASEDQRGEPSASAPLALTGRFRLYFNRHGAAPLSWCIAPESGAWEMAVRSVAITVPAETVYAPKSEPDEEDGRPSAWIAVEGRLEVEAEGRARIA